MNEKTLWDYLDGRRKSIIIQWAACQKLTVRDRAALNSKIRRLAQMDYDLAIGTKLLAGPIFKHVYKLVIHGDVMLRPMLCRGPLDNYAEYTFLLGAVEKGGKLPQGLAEKAEDHREEILNDPTRRCLHQ